MLLLKQGLIGLAALTLGMCFVVASAVGDDRPALQVDAWGYQLQNIRPAGIARSRFDLMVIDYSADGSAAEAFSPAHVAYMKGDDGPNQRRLISYFSIGEAERYRGYWQAAWEVEPPSWLGPENPYWEGNFVVEYWDPGWEAILFGSDDAYLDRILAAGFDGIFLDTVDSYQAFADDRPSAEEEMIELVLKITEYARARSPGFLIIPQNGEGMLADPVYLQAIDAIAKEDLFYGYDGDQALTPVDETEYSANFLDLALAAGKPVLTVDYVNDPATAELVRQRSRERGYIPLTTQIDLDVLPR